ncbi:hypothetical protein [Kushneria marisflavi]|uniref:Uncharacterized protein n=1 Tax=Kushneria marisflavi TaxID=157779 RepID=A0A240UKF9_9GAMM|nr:hypothetical protein [Kushneria marisflavi]ART61987.1 hypothetical protein B9H00_01955 [Kushneria marisflavi]RKD87042.1 hypothetical protein C8D96_0498 [Kushneria marisflavi]
MQTLDSLELAILTRLLNTGRYQRVHVKAIEFGVTDVEFTRAIRYLFRRGLIDATWQNDTSRHLIQRLFRRDAFDQCCGRITEYGLEVVMTG